MTTFRINATLDKVTIIDPYAGATASTSPGIRIPKIPTPKPPEGETLIVPPPIGQGYGASTPGTTPGRSAIPPLMDPDRIPGRAEDFFQKVSVQKHSYQHIRDGYDLLGGTDAYTYTGNSRDRGTFANYPGVSKRYNTNPTTNSTMARLAIPIPGNVKEFIQKSGFGHHMSRLAEAILTNGTTGLGYIDFLLQNIQEAFSEKVQISETVGDNYVAFFFGMAPPVFTFSGQLLNTFQDEWRTSMHMLYQNLLRGTKLARNKQLVSIYYDQMIANGYMLSHNQNFTAEMQMASTFSFQLLIKSITFFRLPRTLPTLPDKLPENIAFQNVYGLQRSAIKRTTRTVGVVKAEAAPSKGTLAPPAEPLSPTEAHKKLELYREAKPSQLTPSL